MPRHAHLSLLRLRDHPALVRILPELQPRSLARLYQAVGMNDAGSLMALTPPALLARALDEAVWTDTGGTPRFDPDVFVDWLEAWIGEGDTFTAERLAALDEDTLALCLGQVLRVEDSHTTAFCRPGEDAEEPGTAGLLEPDDGIGVFDRFLVTTQVEDEWHVIHPALVALWEHAPERLQAVLARLTAHDSRLDGEGPCPLYEDAAAAREDRRERSGFVATAAARAFLAQSTAMSADELFGMSDYDLETARHLRQLESARRAGPARAIDAAEAGEPVSPDLAARRPPGADRADQGADAELWHLLADAGVVDTPAGLLAAPAGRAASALERHLTALAAARPGRLEQAGGELAYLANVVYAAIDLSGESRRPEDVARDLAAATVSLGLELLESHGAAVPLGQPPRLIQAFLLGWRALDALPGRLLEAFQRAFESPATQRYLAHRSWLRQQAASSLADLETALNARRYDGAREAVGLLSLAFETDACRAAVHLLAEPPRFPGLLEGAGKDVARWFSASGDLHDVDVLLNGLGPKT